MRKSVVVLATAALLVWACGAQAVWIDVGDAFESPAPGGTPDGWDNPAYAPVVTSTTHVYAGSQSAELNAQAIIRKARDFTGINEYSFMFYDDMAATKSGRAGLMRAADIASATGAARFGAVAVETTQSTTNYVAHHGWGFFVSPVWPRSEGWHEARIAWSVNGAGNTVVDFFIDGIHGDQYTHTGVLSPVAEYIGAPYGSGASSMWFDTVPEPASLVLLACGGLFLRRRRA